MELADDSIASFTSGGNDEVLASQSPSNEISYEDIATKLLNDNLLLTALELYAELVEAGKDLPKLRNYFSNPGNFEHQASAKPQIVSTTIPRSLSQATLDSLDLTRYSEDGERGVDERVAVLEFELRKAKETISALRANLTVATESDTPSSDGATNDPLKPHEKRALNFLVNEYLLVQGYKLTAITFADENENQDFETWDDVGLNIPKPAELHHLYRDYMKKSGHHELPKEDNSCQTDLTEDLTALQDEVSALQNKVNQLEREKSELQEQLWSSERIESEAIVSEERCNAGSANTENEDGWTAVSMGGMAADEDQVSADIDWASVGISTPDQLKGSASGSGTSASDPRSRDDVDSDWTVSVSAPASASALATPTAEKHPLLSRTDASERYKAAFARTVPVQFQRELAVMCLAVDLGVAVGSGEGDVVSILGNSLPKIIPNVILNKREEVIPLLVAAISSNPDQKQRDLLLNHLFNLKKRPEDEERRQILAGLRSVAASMTRVQVENEILPQCWEQLSHRHVERRLLVAEACTVLAPYITPAIRNSLVLSMLQQMLSEDREDVVRVAVVRCSALIASMSPDSEKYSQCEDIVVLCLGDSSPEVVNTTLKTLVLVVAQWALTAQRLQSSLLPRLISVLIAHLSKAQGDRESGKSLQFALAVVRAITTVLPHVVISVTSSETVVSHVRPLGLPLPHPRGGFAELCKGLANPLVFYEASHGELMAAFDDLLKEESPMWPELAWIPEKMIPELVEALCLVKPSEEELLNAFVSLFRFLCSGIGHVFTAQQIKPVLLQTVQKVEKDLVEQGRSPDLSVITVYIAGVLALAQTEKELEELRSTFGSFLLALPMCRTSATSGLDCLKAVVVSICGLQREPLTNTVLTVLWDGLTSPKAPVRCTTCTLFMAMLGAVPDNVVLSRITPALVTLASDPDISVRTSAIPAIGKLITTTNTKEVQEKVRLQLQSILSDSSTTESSQLMLQLVTTLGQIISSCDATFRDQVVLPQLAALATHASHLQNPTGRSSLAAALTVAFASPDYCALPKAILSGCILPGLRQLEQLTPHLQPEHRETLYALIKEVETQLNMTAMTPFQKEEKYVPVAPFSLFARRQPNEAANFNRFMPTKRSLKMSLF